MLSQKKSKKKRFNKRLYIYMALVTMAIVSLFTKPIKKSFTTLEKYLSSTTHKKTTLRENLESSQSKPNTSVNNLLVNASHTEKRTASKLIKVSRIQSKKTKV